MIPYIIGYFVIMCLVIFVVNIIINKDKDWTLDQILWAGVLWPVFLLACIGAFLIVLCDTIYEWYIDYIFRKKANKK